MTRHSDSQNRRDFVRNAALGVGVLIGSSSILDACASAGIAPSSATQGWDLVPGILSRIVPPKFASRDFDITKYGAVGDGTTDCSAAFRQAIGACTGAGGGRVTVPAGRFLTGPIHLASNVNLHVEKDGIIAFSRNSEQYLPPVLTRFEGVELMNYSPFIYALDCDNVAITGSGTLDGQANTDFWWPWKGTPESGWKEGMPRAVEPRLRLFKMAEDGVPVSQRVFGTGGYLRPQFIQPYRCRNVLIEGVTILNSPMWEIHPVLCTNVTVRNVKIATFGPNNDGCDPESCRDVLIEGCDFNTGDDCIAIKSGRNADGRRLHTPSENIIIRNCRMQDGHGGVTIGSEISGGVRNVFAHDCTMDSPHLDRALRLKNNAARGGLLEHIYMRDITVGQLADSVLQIDLLYEEGSKGEFVPIIRDVELRNVTSKKSKYGLYIRGYEKSEISNVRIIDCDFQNVANGNVVDHVTGLVLKNVRMNGAIVS